MYKGRIKYWCAIFVALRTEPWPCLYKNWLADYQQYLDKKIPWSSLSCLWDIRARNILVLLDISYIFLIHCHLISYTKKKHFNDHVCRESRAPDSRTLMSLWKKKPLIHYKIKCPLLQNIRRENMIMRASRSADLDLKLKTFCWRNLLHGSTMKIFYIEVETITSFKEFLSLNPKSS